MNERFHRIHPEKILSRPVPCLCRGLKVARNLLSRRLFGSQMSKGSQILLINKTELKDFINSPK